MKTLVSVCNEFILTLCDEWSTLWIWDIFKSTELILHQSFQFHSVIRLRSALDPCSFFWVSFMLLNPDSFFFGMQTIGLKAHHVDCQFLESMVSIFNRYSIRLKTVFWNSGRFFRWIPTVCGNTLLLWSAECFASAFQLLSVGFSGRWSIVWCRA